MRALLDLMRENEASVKAKPVHCRDLLQRASTRFQMLDSERWEEELVKFVAAELARLTVLIAENSQRQ